jgi:hypothetical protein
LQNKANVKIGKMDISIAKKKAYADKQRTISYERYPKQTQTNPISNDQSQFQTHKQLTPLATREIATSAPMASPALLQATAKPQMAQGLFGVVLAGAPTALRLIACGQKPLCHPSAGEAFHDPRQKALTIHHLSIKHVPCANTLSLVVVLSEV